jgi:hypothetical protein
VKNIEYRQNQEENKNDRTENVCGIEVHDQEYQVEEYDEQHDNEMDEPLVLEKLDLRQVISHKLFCEGFSLYELVVVFY